MGERQDGTRASSSHDARVWVRRDRKPLGRRHAFFPAAESALAVGAWMRAYEARRAWLPGEASPAEVGHEEQDKKDDEDDPKNCHVILSLERYAGL